MEKKKMAYHEIMNHLKEKLLPKWPEFDVGDRVKVHYKIKEGDKERVQVYEGDVIALRGAGIDRTFNVRRISHDVGVERIFPMHTPAIAKIELVRKGRVRRAKLYYLRHKLGKSGRISEARSEEKGAAAKAKPKAKAASKKATAAPAEA